MPARSLLALSLLSVVACQDPPESSQQFPVRQDWSEAECEQGIPLPRDAAGNYLVTDIRVGGSLKDNFRTEGDVIVEFADDRDSMDVCYRKFASGAKDKDPQADYDRLAIWLGKADARVPNGDRYGCASGWQDDCIVQVYSPGLTKQKQRSGMDLRITLPSEYRGSINVETKDLLDGDYLNPGNVCVWDLPGRAEIVLERGQALIKHAQDLSVAPTCPAADAAACDVAGWSADCPCMRDSHALGVTKITSDNNADIIVQTPGDIWTKFSADTVLPLGGSEYCPIRVAVDGAELDKDDPGTMVGSVSAPEGNTASGYNIRAEAGRCAPLEFFEDPEMFRPGAKGEEDPQRGEVTICDDCIRNTSCDDFLDGGLRVQLPS